MTDATPPDGRARRLARGLAVVAVGLAAVAMILGIVRAAAGAGGVAMALPPLSFALSGLATLAGLAPGLAVLPLCLILVELDVLDLGAGDLAATVYVATLPAMLAALAMRWLAARAEGRTAFDRDRLALVAAVAATAVPVAVATAAALDGPDRALIAAQAIAGLIVATLVAVLAFAATTEAASPPATRLERFDWRMCLILGVVGGYAVGHVPFGPAELILVYLVMRGFPPGFAAGAALAAGTVPALAVLPLALARHAVDFPLAFAIVPAAFSGSVAAGWWLRGLNPLRGANALALIAVATNLGIIILALR
jgi:uncharacterized membrane protein YfcA